VGATHSPVKPNISIAPEPTDVEEKQTDEERIRAQRVSALEKARATKVANKENK